MARPPRRPAKPTPQAAPAAPPDQRDSPNEQISHQRLATYGTLAMVFLVAIQTVCNTISIHQGGEQFQATIQEIRSQSETISRIFQEQQRARLSFRLHVEEVEDSNPTLFRIVSPFAIGGTTEARHVTFKNYYTTAPPRQQQYLSSLELDWTTREGHPLSDVSPTEDDRRFVAAPFNQPQLVTIVSEQQSLYFIGRLEYCDIYGACRYFMRCAEIGRRPDLVTYCGTEIGTLPADPNDE